MVWAKWADVTFVQDPNGEDKALIRALEPMVAAGSTLSLPLGKSGKYVLLPALPIDNPIKEKTSWYSWTDLLHTLENPQIHPRVRRELGKIRQSLCSDMLSSDIAKTIRAGKPYNRFAQGDEVFQIEAAWAVPGKSGALLQSVRPDDPNGKVKLVSVAVKRDDKLIDFITARRGRVTLADSQMTNAPQVTIRLEDDVTVQHVGAGPMTETKVTTWSRGAMPLPEGILAKSQKVTLADLYQDPNALTKDPKVVASIRRLTHKRVPQLKADLIAELHVRVAYGASCFLMVAMGAALGLMFRGGQFISAFALSAVPAAAVIIMLLMGKEMVRNPSSSETVGLACIWGGIAMLLVANVVIYARLRADNPSRNK